MFHKGAKKEKNPEKQDAGNQAVLALLKEVHADLKENTKALKSLKSNLVKKEIPEESIATLESQQNKIVQKLQRIENSLSDSAATSASSKEATETSTTQLPDSVEDKQTQKVHLYQGDFCPFSQRVCYALLIKDIPFTRTVLAMRGKKPDSFVEYCQKNNLEATFPVIRIGEKVYGNTKEILKVLDEEFPDQTPLVPKDAKAEDVEKWYGFSDKTLGTSMRLFFGNVAEDQIEPKKKTVVDNLQEFCQALQGPFFFGEQISIVDLAAFNWIDRFIPVFQKFKQFDMSDETVTSNILVTWVDRMRSHPHIAPGRFNQESMMKWYLPMVQMGPIAVMPATHNAIRNALKKIETQIESLTDEEYPKLKISVENLSTVYKYHSRMEDDQFFAIIEKERGNVFQNAKQQHEELDPLVLKFAKRVNKKSVEDQKKLAKKLEKLKVNIEEHFKSEEQSFGPVVRAWEIKKQKTVIHDLFSGKGALSLKEVVEFVNATAQFLSEDERKKYFDGLLNSVDKTAKKELEQLK